MKAKVIQDGNRVIITFTGIENPEEFVEKVVRIVSDSSENEVTPQKVLGLAPPPESYEKEDVEEVVETKEAVKTSKEDTSTSKSKEEKVVIPKETETVEAPKEVVETVDKSVETIDETMVTETPSEEIVSEEKTELQNEGIETSKEVEIPKETVEVLKEDTIVSEEMENSESQVEEAKKPVEDFAAPYTGMTPEQIFKAPKYEGFYFLCRAEIPERYKEVRREILYNYAKSRDFFVPPYGNAIRMKGYLNMANRILDLKDIELIKKAANDKTLSEKDLISGLETACRQLHKELEKFFNNL